MRVAVDTSFKQYTVKMKKPMGLTFEEVEGGKNVISRALSPHKYFPGPSQPYLDVCFSRCLTDGA